MNTLAKPKENLIDPLILIPILLLTSISALFIFSASNVIASENFNNPFFFIERQVVAFALSLIMFSVFLFIPISFYRENGLLLFFLSAFLLALVLIPGIGREVNGSRRTVQHLEQPLVPGLQVVAVEGVVEAEHAHAVLNAG